MSIPPDGRPAVTRRRALLVVAGCLLVVTLLAVAVVARWEPLLRVDDTVSRALYAGDDRARWLNGLLQVVTAPGLAIVRYVVLVPVVVRLLQRRAGWTAAWVVVAAVGISPLTTAVKDLVGRVRPGFSAGGAQYTSLSFPSGHSSGIATLVTMLLVLTWPVLRPQWRRWWSGIGVALVVLVGCSRMWLGVHYLSDVVAGWLFGLAWTLAVACAFDALPGGRGALRGRAPAVPEVVA